MVVLRDQWQQYLRIPSLFALFIKKTLSIKNSVTLFNQTVVKVWEGLGQSNLHFNQTYFSFFPLRQSFWFFQNQIKEIFFIEKHMIWPLHHLISSFGSIFEYCIRVGIRKKDILIDVTRDVDEHHYHYHPHHY